MRCARASSPRRSSSAAPIAACGAARAIVTSPASRRCSPVEGRAHEQRIRTGRPDGNRIEVLEGCEEATVILDPRPDRRRPGA
jgi:hypothetical protein